MRRSFLREWLTTKNRYLFFQKNSITDVWQGPKYASEHHPNKAFKPAGKYLDSYMPTWASPFEEKTFNKITSFFPAGNYMLKV